MDKKNILIVEDDNFVAEVYSTKLLEMGHECADSSKRGSGSFHS